MNELIIEAEFSLNDEYKIKYTKDKGYILCFLHPRCDVWCLKFKTFTIMFSTFITKHEEDILKDEYYETLDECVNLRINLNAPVLAHNPRTQYEINGEVYSIFSLINNMISKGIEKDVAITCASKLLNRQIDQDCIPE